jgi:cobyrinic acid a,c-diamide synthase
MDKAFNFYYQDSLDLLEAWGAEVVPFSPLEDSALPDGTGGVYLGGGFPEIFADELARNDSMKDSIREAHRRDLPIYAECGGLMYLGRELTDFDGARHKMVGLLPVSSSMHKSRLTLGYREVEALADGPLLAKGQQMRGHEFHWSIADAPPDELAAYAVLNQPRHVGVEGLRVGSVWASYVHLHMGSDVTTARRFVAACAN